MAERPILSELRAVDAALAPLAPSRELDHRVEALLAGRAPRRAPPRLALAGLGLCAAAAALALWFGTGKPSALAVAPPPAMAPPSVVPAAPVAAPQNAPATMPTHERPPPAALALVDRAAATHLPEQPALLARAAPELEAPIEQPGAPDRRQRRAVTGSRPAPGSIVGRPAQGGLAGDTTVEDALAALRADKARGDLRGAVARIDALLVTGVAPRAAAVVRLERARLLERLGEHAAACDGLAGLRGDDADAARLRLSCP